MKILFTDLDGTLLTDNKQISIDDMQAIQEMISLGHKFVLTTGRPLTSVKNLAKKFGFFKSGFFLVSFNGGLIYDCEKNESLLTQKISVNDVKFIMDEAHKRGFHAHSYSGDYVVSEYETKELKTYCNLMQMEYLIVKDVRDFFAKKNNSENAPIKVNVISALGHKSLVEFRLEMRKTTEKKLYDVFSKREMLEFSGLKTNKGEAVRFMSNFYNVSLKDTIAVGDEENDLSMIETAGIGIAMQNASDVIKKSATYVTQNDNNHAGIAEVIKKFVLF